MTIRFLAAVACLYLFASTSGAAPATAPTRGPDRKRVEQIAAMLPPSPQGVGRPITDRAAWKPLAEGKAYDDLVARAVRAAEQPVPELSDELYLEFSRTGTRTGYESIVFNRRANFVALVFAECLEDRGRFLPRIGEYIDALCAQRSWVWPAHDKNLGTFNGKVVEIDLGVAELGWQMATARWLLAERLTPQQRQRIAENVNRRVVEPYLAAATGKAKPFSWMSRTSNWNSVCHAGVVGAALATADDRVARATCVASAEHYTQRFIEGFGTDGYCSEGLGYWNYGFGHYVLLAETVRQATDGSLDMMARPGVAAISAFGRRIQIKDGVAPAFADCSLAAAPWPQILRYVDARFTPAGRYDRGEVRSERGFLYDLALYAFLDPATLPKLTDGPASPADSPLRTWFDAAGVLIARPAESSTCRIGVALKGGHNAELHNHNDLGSYVVVTGGRAVLLDPGTERYTARTFGPRRYDSKLLNSFGHPVPLVAGELQRTGAEARAQILKAHFTDDRDTLSMDITSAYAVPELKRLERTFVYDRRGAGSLTVTDRVEFATPQLFGSAMITLGKMTRGDEGVLRIADAGQELSVTIDAAGAAYDIAEEPIRENSSVTPTRIGINLTEKTAAATITLTIRPRE